MSDGITLTADWRNRIPKVTVWPDQQNNAIEIALEDNILLFNPSTVAKAFKILIENEMDESVIDADFLLLLKQYADKALKC